MEETRFDPIKALEERINSCVDLLPISKEKVGGTKDLISRSAGELLRLDFKTSIQAKKNFSTFVNKSLSAIEVLGLEDMQYKAARKIILSEIYACLDFVSSGLEKAKQ